MRGSFLFLSASSYHSAAGAARASQEMHFSAIYRLCDSAERMDDNTRSFATAAEIPFSLANLVIEPRRGSERRCDPPSTCLFWRARWVQSSLLPLKVPPPTLPEPALQEGGNGCALGNFPKRTQFGLLAWLVLACSVSPFLLAKERRGVEEGGGM